MGGVLSTKKSPGTRTGTYFRLVVGFVRPLSAFHKRLIGINVISLSMLIFGDNSIPNSKLF